MRISPTIIFPRRVCLLLIVVWASLFSNSCKRDEVVLPPLTDEATSVLTDWADLTMRAFTLIGSKTPTYVSRSLGYLGVAMYESVVHADKSQRSLAGQLSQLTSLPQPLENGNYHWPLVAAASQDTLLRLLFVTQYNIGQDGYKYFDSLARALWAKQTQNVHPAVITDSRKLGWDIALAIYEWSKTDGGHDMYKQPWDQAYNFPSGPSYWIPPVGGQTSSIWPLHPHWGNNRRFVPTNANQPIPPIAAYSTDPASAYYKLYDEVYKKNIQLTQEEIDIAAWWSDDPSESYSPPGHSYNLATIAIKKANPGIVKAAETYARVGMAVADAFINVWKVKTTYFNERPSTYVRANINSTWVQYWPEPPFPAFPSGHSIQSAATATVLTGLYGDNFSFVDNTNEGKMRFFPLFRTLNYTRSFNNFWETAEEAAHSRFLGGIHTKQDNQTGLDMGKKVGANINALMWRQ